jgi:hypothetical protein
MYVVITARPDPDDIDRDSGAGLTDDAWMQVTDALMDLGFDEIDVQTYPAVDER